MNVLQQRNRDWDADHVIDHLWVGALSSTRNSEVLKERGIRNVLTIASHLKVEHHPGLCYFRVDILDHPDANLLAVLADCLKFVESCDGNVLIHCASGISRSVSVSVAYVMKTKGMSLAEALVCVRTKRCGANPNVGFYQQLVCLEKHKNDIHEAEIQYSSQVGSINDIISSQRDEANRLYGEVDKCENTLKSTTRGEQVHTEAVSSLHKLLHELDLMEPGVPLTDKPADMIRKMAKKKAERLLKEETT